MRSHISSILRQLGPGIILPGLIYFSVSRHAPTLIALAAASSVPLLDALIHLLRGRTPSMVGLVFIAFAGLSAGLAMALHSPMFILAKGAVISALAGMAFAISAAVKRPLTRTLAIRLSARQPEERRRLTERWGHPNVLSVFRTLSLAWGALLLATAVQQGALAVTVSPGTVMAVDGPLHAVVTAGGIALSIFYVRRRQRANPDLALLPGRVR